MSLIERAALATAAIAAGALAGRIIRTRLQPGATPKQATTDLPAGVVLVSAPFCTRCSDLGRRLIALGVSFRTIDAATNGRLLKELGLTTAPTLLAVDLTGRVIDREDRDFSSERITQLGDKSRVDRS